MLEAHVSHELTAHIDQPATHWTAEGDDKPTATVTVEHVPVYRITDA